jgi:hypothetical protein
VSSDDGTGEPTLSGVGETGSAWATDAPGRQCLRAVVFQVPGEAGDFHRPLTGSARLEVPIGVALRWGAWGLVEAVGNRDLRGARGPSLTLRVSKTITASVPTLLAVFAPEEFGEEEGVAEVAAGEAFGFGGDAVQPFQTAAAHPLGGAGLVAGEEVDGGADT